ncbi:MAG: SprT-like domain-containing protein [Pseudomonadota bacterium]
MPQTDASPPDLTLQPTRETYDALQQAYEHFNWALFDQRLPNCLITLQRRGRGFGFFAAGRLRRGDGARADEIALNPARFRGQGDLATLAVLAHEMVHLWQHHFGAPGRARYHNAEWALQMRRIGLQPSHDGTPDGRSTGDVMHHLIVANGPFEAAARDLIARGFEIVWQDGPTRPAAGGRGGRRSKFVCPVCGLAAWSRPGARLLCAAHRVEMTARV